MRVAAMKCYRCKRLIGTPARVIPINGGEAAYGYRCAVKAGLITPRDRHLFSPQIKQTADDPLQLKLDLT